MYGSGQEYLSNLRKIEKSNTHQTKIKTKSDIILNDAQTKPLNVEIQSADYLVEYFEGMILKYINIHESQGKSMDTLKEFIINHDKNTKLKGGCGNNEYIKNHKIYKNFDKDSVIKKEEMIQFDNEYWDIMKIKVKVIYKNKYYIHIKHEKDGHNKIDLKIDLQHNAIIDKNLRSYNDYICVNTNNINHILENIIKKLINCFYINDFQLIELYMYGKNNEVIHKFDQSYGDSNMLKSIVSLLIMILTLRNNTNENIYKSYNTTLLLSAIYKNLIIPDEDDECFDVFAVNNNFFLTYLEEKNSMCFEGDCVLNSLMTVKNVDLRELFVDKISFSQNKFVNKEKRDSGYYINKIDKILKELSIITGYNKYINKIQSYVKNYNVFINFINNEYLNFKNAVNGKEYINLGSAYKFKFVAMYNHLKKFINIIKNNLLDYNLEDNEIKEIFDNLDISNMVKNYKDEEETKIYTLALKEFIKLMDIIIKYKNKDSFNIFYINLLISLLLIKYKINYLFDNNIIKILKCSENKANVIKCFRNVEHNKNELGLFFPMYQKGDNEEEDKYLFKYTYLKELQHAIVFIININKNERRTYIYDINESVMYGTDYLDKQHTYDYTDDQSLQEYHVYNYNKRWILNKYTLYIHKCYNENEISIELENISTKNNVVKSLNSLVFDNNGIFDFNTLFNLAYKDYSDNNFNHIYHEYKIKIFEELLNYCNGQIKILKNNQDYLNLMKLIIEHVNIIIGNDNDNDNDIKNLLFKFVDCLIECKLKVQFGNNIQINLNNEYNNIVKCFNDTYNLDTTAFITYLDFKKYKKPFCIINKYITNVLDKLMFKYNKVNIVKGGYANINYNSIIKNILIILLIIVIIIIVVLIVLFIINKYNNIK